MQQKTYSYSGAENREALLDITWNKQNQSMPLVLFIHGFKGFKDWGAFPLVAEEFAQQGFVFAKMNLSHNGTTPNDPLNFADLEAFGHNTFSKELADIDAVVEMLPTISEVSQAWDGKTIYLLGHSRGGAIGMIYAGQNKNIQKIATWGAVADLSNRFTPQQLEYWEKEGVIYIHNGRTKQDMPLYHTLVTDYLANQPRINVENQVKAIDASGRAQLIIHGTGDETVSVNDAKQLQEWNPSAVLKIYEGANHTFGSTHPWSNGSLPSDLQQAVSDTVAFLR
jgi:dienelactone hydrolase